MQAFYAKGVFKKTVELQLKHGHFDEGARSDYDGFRIANLATVPWFEMIEIPNEQTCIATISIRDFNWLPIQTIDIDYQLALKSQRGEEHDVVVHVEKQFTSTDNDLSVSIPNFSDYLQFSSGFLDDKCKLKLEFSIGVKNTVAIDTVEMIDLFRSDPLTNDHEVCINGVTYFVSKPMIGFQSMLFHLCLEAKNFEAFATYSDEDIHVFLQILHGVDMPVSKTTVNGIMQLADKFKVARVTGLCIQYLINGCDDTCAERWRIAIKFGHIEVFLGIINTAKTFSQLKEQKWDCNYLSKPFSVYLARRVFELNGAQ